MRLSLRFSLRSLLVFTAFFSVACIALKNAGAVWWTALSGISLLTLMAMAIIAFVGRGTQRAFAIGFTVCALIYAGMLMSLGSSEFDPYSGSLPTSTVMRPVLDVVAVRKFMDVNTGKEVPPPAPGSSAASIGVLETPDRNMFMRIAHLLWADALALIGGMFAMAVYVRTKRDE